MKSRSTYERNYKKYTNLLQLTEDNIKARDSSVHDHAHKGMRESEVSDGFLNRSLTKVLFVSKFILDRTNSVLITLFYCPVSDERKCANNG